MASGIIIFSGTVQFVSIALMSTGSVLMAGLTALMVSARHIFFSISMIGRYSKEGPRKWYLYYALCDETYAMLSKDDVPEGVNVSGYRLLVTLFDQLSWLIGCVLLTRILPVIIFGRSEHVPELIAMAVVVASYLWKRNTIVSVVLGTAVYMVLLQMVFI